MERVQQFYRLPEETCNRTYPSSAFLIVLTISLFVKGLPAREQITQKLGRKKGN
jgi:hypothetical protein